MSGENPDTKGNGTTQRKLPSALLRGALGNCSVINVYACNSKVWGKNLLRT